ncbi:hypothetical protein AOQ84DRAFT_424802 [Glonium stellatum]|uniref:Uncharacterized protein n=1 Tax=Glonium stellatum TaxID=574774 RepID=A0A8E2ENJ7_9PEZI|nr:hypothetical protein AOQ84DRAFT_424802 [Glonium stellatum]
MVARLRDESGDGAAGLSKTVAFQCRCGTMFVPPDASCPMSKGDGPGRWEMLLLLQAEPVPRARERLAGFPRTHPLPPRKVARGCASVVSTAQRVHGLAVSKSSARTSIVTPWQACTRPAAHSPGAVQTGHDLRVRVNWNSSRLAQRDAEGREGGAGRVWIADAPSPPPELPPAPFLSPPLALLFRGEAAKAKTAGYRLASGHGRHGALSIFVQQDTGQTARLPDCQTAGAHLARTCLTYYQASFEASTKTPARCFVMPYPVRQCASNSSVFVPASPSRPTRSHQLPSSRTRIGPRVLRNTTSPCRASRSSLLLGSPSALVARKRASSALPLEEWEAGRPPSHLHLFVSSPVAFAWLDRQGLSPPLPAAFGSFYSFPGPSGSR